MHKGHPICEWIGRFADRLDLGRLPPLAPMINLVEPLWNWAIVVLAKVRDDQAFLFDASKLPIPRP